MFREGEPKPTENFIGDMTFGITLESVQSYFSEIQEELEEINEQLTKEDTLEKLREFSEKRKVKIKNLLEVSPAEVFSSVQEIYNFVHELEEKGLTNKDILQKIKDEKPNLFQDISRFYGVLRSQSWGYLLGQGLYVFRLKSSL